MLLVRNGSIAQPGERPPHTREVVGSSPTAPILFTVIVSDGGFFIHPVFRIYSSRCSCGNIFCPRLRFFAGVAAKYSSAAIE